MRRILAISGGIAFLGGLLLFGLFLYVVQLDLRARRLDTLSEAQSAGGCSHALQAAAPPTRTPVIGETLLLALAFLNENSRSCDVTVRLEAAGFDKDPASPRTYVLSPGSSTRYWSIAAKQAGEHKLLLSSGNVSLTLGINVLPNPFFGASTTLILSAFLSLLGPMATIPWWIERFRGRQTDKTELK